MTNMDRDFAKLFAILIKMVSGVFAATCLSPMMACADSSTKAEVMIGGKKAWVWASTELDPKSGRYSVKNIVDDDLSTAWVEGEKGLGEGASISVEFQEQNLIDGFVLRPGYVKNSSVFTANAAPRVIDVHADGRSLGQYTLNYDASDSDHPNLMGCYHTGAPVNIKAPRIVIFPKPVKAQTLTLTVVEGIPGWQYSDLAITEWKPLLADAKEASGLETNVAEVLKSLRDPAALQKRLVPRAAVEDLRLKYVNLVSGVGYIYIPKQYMLRARNLSDVNFLNIPRVKSELLKKSDSPTDKFLHYTKDSLLGSAVTVEAGTKTTRLIGSRSFSHGSSEYIEFYPVITIDSAFNIKAMFEGVHLDAAPGCESVIPETILPTLVE